MKNPARIAEKVTPASVKKEKGYLYYVDKEGDVSRVPAKWNEDPEFLDHEELTSSLERNHRMQSAENYPVAESYEEDPIPVTENSVPSRFMDKLILYKDQAAIETVGDSCLSIGHAKVYSKDSVPLISVPEDVFIHNATVASFSASILFETLKAQGTNIIFNDINGELVTSVVPRFDNDGLNLFWDMTQGDQERIKAVAENIISNLVIGELRDTTKINLDDKPKKKVNMIDRKVNYKIDHLRRDF